VARLKQPTLGVNCKWAIRGFDSESAARPGRGDPSRGSTGIPGRARGAARAPHWQAAATDGAGRDGDSGPHPSQHGAAALPGSDGLCRFLAVRVEVRPPPAGRASPRAGGRGARAVRRSDTVTVTPGSLSAPGPPGP
jgi:hypothetical protein